MSCNLLILGGSPSPTMAYVTLQGTSTTWVSLETTLALPTYILNNSTTICPGTLTLRANRTNTIPVGKALIVNDTFSVGARMSKIERDLPGFRRSTNITLQYPIEMSELKFLRCLNAGQESVFSWTVSLFGVKR